LLPKIVSPGSPDIRQVDYKLKLRETPRPPWLLFFFILFLSIAACSPQKLTVREIPIERDGQGIAVVKAEIASTQEERAKGLMYRKNLPDGEGMLFIFDRDEVLSFWMKNTLIPLSIAYIAYDGRIIDIKDMYPNDQNSVSSSRSVRYALEVPQGWFSRAGVRTGDIVILGN
jgi:uncharacterized membrane protein (UPF0127 family)